MVGGRRRTNTSSCCVYNTPHYLHSNFTPQGNKSSRTYFAQQSDNFPAKPSGSALVSTNRRRTALKPKDNLQLEGDLDHNHGLSRSLPTDRLRLLEIG